MTDFFENLLSNGELQEKVAELQGRIDAYQMSENEANEIIAELKAENDRLKEEIKKLEDFIKSDGEIDHINHEYTYKLKQTLQEIKTIVKKNISYQDTDSTTRAMTKVLDHITKAEEE